MTCLTIQYQLKIEAYIYTYYQRLYMITIKGQAIVPFPAWSRKTMNPNLDKSHYN